MAKIKWRGGALLGPVPPVMVSCGDMEKSNVVTVALFIVMLPKTHLTSHSRMFGSR